MNTIPTFRSSLAEALHDFVLFKRLQGFEYTSRAGRLVRFDAFLCAQHYRRPVLSADIVRLYVGSKNDLTPLGRHGDLSALRVFSKYLQARRGDSFVLHDYGFRVQYRPRFYLYRPDDIAALLRATRRLKSADPTRPFRMHLLIGLLYVTGLRISEALSLNDADLDLNQARLRVRKGKFGKDRYVPLHPTSIVQLRQWLQRRDRYAGRSAVTPVFCNAGGRRLGRRHVERVFRRLVRECRIGVHAPAAPRLHDLRHTYACNCLQHWQQQGADLQAMLPILATVMGHVNVRSTQIYLHTTAAQLHQAARNFHSFVFNPQ
jgi:site-specific recombinase XerD